MTTIATITTDGPIDIEAVAAEMNENGEFPALQKQLALLGLNASIELEQISDTEIAVNFKAVDA